MEYAPIISSFLPLLCAAQRHWPAFTFRTWCNGIFG